MFNVSIYYHYYILCKYNKVGVLTLNRLQKKTITKF